MREAVIVAEQEHQLKSKEGFIKTVRPDDLGR